MATISSLTELVDSQPADRYISSNSHRNWKISPAEINNILFYNSIGKKNDVYISEKFNSISSNVTYTRDAVGTYTNPDGVLTNGIINEPRFERLIDSSIGLLLDTSTGTAATTEFALLNGINLAGITDFTIMFEFSNNSNLSFAPISNRSAAVDLVNDFRIISGASDSINPTQNEITISTATLNSLLPINKLTVRYDGTSMDAWMNNTQIIAPVSKSGNMFKQNTFYFGEYNGILNHGYIRNFRLYNSALTDDQIKLF